MDIRLTGYEPRGKFRAIRAIRDAGKLLDGDWLTSHATAAVRALGAGDEPRLGNHEGSVQEAALEAAMGTLRDAGVTFRLEEPQVSSEAQPSPPAAAPVQFPTAALVAGVLMTAQEGNPVSCYILAINMARLTNDPLWNEVKSYLAQAFPAIQQAEQQGSLS